MTYDPYTPCLCINIIMVMFHLILNRHLMHVFTGYANEVGEAFRHIVAVRWVYLTYLVSSGYVTAHALQQGVLAKRQTSAHVSADKRLSTCIRMIFSCREKL